MNKGPCVALLLDPHTSTLQDIIGSCTVSIIVLYKLQGYTAQTGLCTPDHRAISLGTALAPLIHKASGQ